MKKFWDKFWDVVPVIWGAIWVGIITVGSVALLIFLAKWFLTLVGVM